jgi:hypothetical protein
LPAAGFPRLGILLAAVKLEMAAIRRGEGGRLAEKPGGSQLAVKLGFGESPDFSV